MKGEREVREMARAKGLILHRGPWVRDEARRYTVGPEKTGGLFVGVMYPVTLDEARELVVKYSTEEVS